MPTIPILIVVPWLEGGGGQAALSGLLSRLPRADTTLVILFAGNRNHQRAADLAGRVVYLDQPRSPLGVLRAALRVRALVLDAAAVYSLMRGSHLVLGVASRRILSRRRFAATFHQLPSVDAAGRRGRVEDVLVRRATRVARLVTSPSARGVEELRVGGYAASGAVALEENLITVSDRPVVPPRHGALDHLRLVFAGRLTEQKGLDRLPVLLDGVTTPVHLRIIGGGELADALPALLARVDDRHHVEVLPHVSGVEEHLDWSDALLLPSRWELNPVVIWEGRARGRATIGSRIPVFEDLALSGPLLVFESPEELGSIATRIAGDQEYRESLHRAAISSFQELDQESGIIRLLTDEGGTDGR